MNVQRVPVCVRRKKKKRKRKKCLLRSDPHHYQSSKLVALTYGSSLEYWRSEMRRQREVASLWRAEAKSHTKLPSLLSAIHVSLVYVQCLICIFTYGHLCMVACPGVECHNSVCSGAPTWLTSHGTWVAQISTHPSCRPTIDSVFILKMHWISQAISYFYG